MSSTLTLYETAAEFALAAAKLHESDLDQQTISDTLEGLAMPVESKARNVALVIKNFDANADAIKAAAEQLMQRYDKIMERRQWLADYLLANMQRCGITKIEHPLVTIAVRTNRGAVVIDDEAKIPWEYMNQKPPEPLPPPRPDKNMIADAIRNGEVIEGARLVHSPRLEIKV